MRVMYDSVDPTAIPPGAEMVAGYIDGEFAWPASGWALFPGAVRVQIAVNPGTNAGHVLDCEQGDATPAQCVPWVLMRRAAGLHPTIYCSSGTMAAVVQAFYDAGQPLPDFWVALWDGKATLPGGWVAKQYADSQMIGRNIDVSVVSDGWHPGGTMTIQDSVVPALPVGGKVYDPAGAGNPQQWLNFSDLTPVVGATVAVGTYVAWTEAKLVDGQWYDRIARPDGTPGDWCLPDAAVDDGGPDPTHFRPPAPGGTPPIDVAGAKADLATSIAAAQSALSKLG